MSAAERLDSRDESWYRDYATRGLTIRAIAARDNVSPTTVHAAIKRVRETIPQETRDARIVDVLDFYARVRERAWELADMPGIPIVDRRGEVVHDAEGEPAYDYSGRLRALDTAMKTIEAERRMLGLDAAQKIEQTVTDQVAAEKAAREAADRLARAGESE
jgi:hypothetical protein